MSDSTPESRLLSLPRELRDQIYREYLFIGAEYGYVSTLQRGSCAGRARHPSTTSGRSALGPKTSRGSTSP
jgi:hypothetical protein